MELLGMRGKEIMDKNFKIELSKYNKDEIIEGISKSIISEYVKGYILQVAKEKRFKRLQKESDKEFEKYLDIREKSFKATNYKKKLIAIDEADKAYKSYRKKQQEIDKLLGIAQK